MSLMCNKTHISRIKPNENHSADELPGFLSFSNNRHRIAALYRSRHEKMRNANGDFGTLQTLTTKVLNFSREKRFT